MTDFANDINIQNLAHQIPVGRLTGFSDITQIQVIGLRWRVWLGGSMVRFPSPPNGLL